MNYEMPPLFIEVGMPKKISEKRIGGNPKKKKEMKNHRQDENASGNKDRSKTLEEESKWHPNTKVHSEP